MLRRGSVTLAALVAAACGAGCATTHGPGIASMARIRAAEALEASNLELRDALAQLRAGSSAASHLRVAQAYQRSRVFDLALRHFTQAIARESRLAAAYDGRARVWRDTGQLQRALGDATRAAYYAPRSAAARNTLGTVLVRLGRQNDARRAFEMAVSLDPAAAYARTNLCVAVFHERAEQHSRVRCVQAGLAAAQAAGELRALLQPPQDGDSARTQQDH